MAIDRPRGCAECSDAAHASSGGCIGHRAADCSTAPQGETNALCKLLSIRARDTYAPCPVSLCYNALGFHALAGRPDARHRSPPYAAYRGRRLDHRGPVKARRTSAGVRASTAERAQCASGRRVHVAGDLVAGLPVRLQRSLRPPLRRRAHAPRRLSLRSPPSPRRLPRPKKAPSTTGSLSCGCRSSPATVTKAAPRDVLDERDPPVRTATPGRQRGSAGSRPSPVQPTSCPIFALRQRVAPSVLPDLVLLDSRRLWELADLGLLSPLEMSPMQRSPDFYQFALDSAAYNGEWYGVPYAADVLHLAGFLKTEETAPNTWNELLTADEPYLYAAAGPDAYQNGSVLLQYVGAGGQLLENGSTSSEEALGAVFEFTKAAQESGVIPETVTELATLDGVWNALDRTGMGLGQCVGRPLPHRSRDCAGAGLCADSDAQRPTGDVGHDLVTRCPRRRRRTASAGLRPDRRLAGPGVQGAWSQYVHRLPTQRSALQAWSSPSAYTDFLNRQLEVAVALPNGRASSPILRSACWMPSWPSCAESSRRRKRSPLCADLVSVRVYNA